MERYSAFRGVLVAAALGVLGSACHRRSAVYGSNPPEARCVGDPYVVVSNQTPATFDVYFTIERSRKYVGTARPGRTELRLDYDPAAGYVTLQELRDYGVASSKAGAGRATTTIICH